MGRYALLLLCVIIIAVSGCGAFESDDFQSVSLNRQFTLQVGQEAHITDEGLSITMLSVPEDSRCPEDVVCVWAGNAKVRLEAVKINENPATVELNTNQAGGPMENNYSTYTVKLVELAPAPKSGQTIGQGDYVAGLVITKK